MEDDNGSPQDEIQDDVNPCLIVMNSQVEDSEVGDVSSRVKRLQELSALKNVENSSDLVMEEEDKMRGQTEEEEEEDEEAVPPSQEDEEIEKKGGQTMAKSMTYTPSQTISTLHLSGQFSVLVPETSDETISSLQMSDEAPFIIPSSPSGLASSGDSVEREEQQDKEEVQVPEWQKAINAAEQPPTSGSSSKEFSVSDNSVSTSSESLGSGSNSYPSLQLLQNWQDPNQVDSSSQSVNLAAEKSDLAVQASASSLKRHSKSQGDEELKDSVQIIGEVHPDKGPHSTVKRAEASKPEEVVCTESEGAEITDVSSSQDLHLRFSQSQAETETEGIGVHIDAAFRRGFSSGQRTTSSDQLSQADFVGEDESLQKSKTISEEREVSESKQLPSDKPFGGGVEKKAHSTHDGSTRLTKSLDYEAVSSQQITTDKVSSQPAKGSEVKGHKVEQDRSVTPTSLTETSSKDSLLESNTSQYSGLSFHLNAMMKDGSKMSPFEMKRDLLNAKTPRHSTPIMSQDDGNDTSMNQADTEMQNTVTSKSTSVTISDQDSVNTNEEPVFHLNVPSKDEIRAIRESPSKKKVSVFSRVQEASFTSAKQLHLHTDEDGDTQDDENPFGTKQVPEFSNRAKSTEKREDPIEVINSSESNSSSDTIPVDFSVETQPYGTNIHLITASPEKGEQNQDMLSIIAIETKENPVVQREDNSARKKRRKRGRKENKEIGKVPIEGATSRKRRDPFEFTESQSNRVPSPLKQDGGNLLTRSRARGDSNADKVTRKITTRQRKLKETASPKTGRNRATTGGEGDKNNTNDKPPDKEQDQSKGEVPQCQASSNPRTTALRTHASVLRQSSSSSSSGGIPRPSSLSGLPEDIGGAVEITYDQVVVVYRRKKVSQDGRLIKTYVKEVSRVIEAVEGSESEEWSTSPTSVSSGYLGDASSLGSRSSSNTGSLHKSVSMGSKSSSSSASLGKNDSSPAKTPSPQVPTQGARSLTKRSSSSSSSKSPHSAVHFSPELESTAPRISNDKDATEETFVKPDRSVPRKSVSPKAGSGRKEPLPSQIEVEGSRTMTEKGKGDHEDDTIMVEPSEKEITKEQSAIMTSEGNLEGIGRDADSSIPIRGGPDTSESTVLTELPGHEEEMETEVVADVEGSKQAVSQKERSQPKGRRGRRKSSRSSVTRKGILDTSIEGNDTNESQSLSTAGTSQPQSTHGKEEEGEEETNLITAAASVREESQFEILTSPPRDTPSKEESQASVPYSEEVLNPGRKVLCKWPQSGFYYPSIILKWVRDNKYLVLFDDYSQREVPRGNIVCKEWLSKGQPVYVSLSEEFIDSAIIIGYHKDDKTKAVGYVIEDSQGVCRRVPKSQVLLKKEQATSLINSCSSSSSEVTLENIVTGKRTTRSSKSQRTTPPTTEKKQEKTKFSATQQSGERMTKRRSKKVEMTPDSGKLSPSEDSSVFGTVEPAETQKSLQTEGPTMREESSGSTPRSGVKRKIVSQESPKDADVPVRKRLALGKSPVHTKETPSPEVAARLRRSPRKRHRAETDDPSLPSTSRHGPTADPSLEKYGPLSENKNLFKGINFILTQFELGPRNASSEEGFSREEMRASYNKEFAKKQVTSGGGTVLRDLEKARVCRENIFLIADSYYRTKKYLLALACGIPCLSHLWLNECCRTGKMQRYQDYILPAGKSFEEDCVVEWKPHRYDVMSGLTVMLVMSVEDIHNTWRTLLIAAGCKLVTKLPNNWETSRDIALTCDVIITDPACPPHIRHRARQLGIPVVSAEWAVQCLINGKRVRYDGNHRYEWDYSEID